MKPSLPESLSNTSIKHLLPEQYLHEVFLPDPYINTSTKHPLPDPLSNTSRTLIATLQRSIPYQILLTTPPRNCYSLCPYGNTRPNVITMSYNVKIMFLAIKILHIVYYFLIPYRHENNRIRYESIFKYVELQ